MLKDGVQPTVFLAFGLAVWANPLSFLVFAISISYRVYGFFLNFKLQKRVLFYFQPLFNITRCLIFFSNISLHGLRSIPGYIVLCNLFTEYEARSLVYYLFFIKVFGGINCVLLFTYLVFILITNIHLARPSEVWRHSERVSLCLRAHSLKYFLCYVVIFLIGNLYATKNPYNCLQLFPGLVKKNLISLVLT